MESLSLNTADLCHHVATFGIDIYPHVEIPNERTRLNMFYEEARDRWGELFDRLVISDTEFKISKSFRGQPQFEGRSIPFDTFTLTNRGPVFVFPLVLPDPVRETGLEESYLERFRQVRTLFFAALLNRKIMRVGLIRDVVFNTGQATSVGILTNQQSFAGAELVGGNSLVQYRDARCNVRIELESVELMKATRLPVGTTVEQREGYGLRVRLDVNNSEIRPLDESDIEEVVERATSLWPNELLQYLGERRPS